MKQESDELLLYGYYPVEQPDNWGTFAGRETLEEHVKRS